MGSLAASAVAAQGMGPWLLGDISPANATAVAALPGGVGQAQAPTARHGFAQLPEGARAASAAVVAHFAEGEAVHAEVLKVAAWHFNMRALPVTSASALAAAIGVSRKVLNPLCRRLAAGFVNLQRVRVSLLEQLLASALPRAHLVHYVESVQYDETPLPIRVRQDVAAMLAGDQAAGVTGQATQGFAAGAAAGAAAAAAGQSVALPGTRGVFGTGVAHKVVQTRGEVAVVIRVGDRYATVSYPLVHPLATVERTTARCLSQLQVVLSPVGPGCRAFMGVTRAATTDAYAANKLVEARIAAARSLDATQDCRVHFLCEVHATASVYGRTFALMEDQVNGVIRTALSLHHSSAMQLFRRCLRQEIASRLQVLPGAPRDTQWSTRRSSSPFP
jgi:hypothetical protein